MGKIKRFAALFLAAALLLPAVPARAAGYADTGGHWARAEIDRWSSLGIIEGEGGRFRPDDPITRAEMAVIIDRLMKYRTASKNSFQDLPSTWYTEAVLRANAAGVLLGDAGKVRPTDYITRQEAAVMLCRALGIAETAGATGFSDDSSIAFWARPYIKSLAGRGLLSGVGGNRYAPQDRITRASVVKLLDNAVAEIYSVSGGYSKSANGAVIVCSSGVTLSNMSISGDLIISEGVGQGGVTLNNVYVGGSTIIRGGNEISLSDTRLSALRLEARDGFPRVRALGGTTVNHTYLLSSAALEEAPGLTGNGFGDLQASADRPVRVDLFGAFGSLTQAAANADYRVQGSLGDISVLAGCDFTGDFSYRSLNVAYGAGCRINGELVSGGSADTLQGLTITSSSSDGLARVGDILTAAAVTTGSVYITYKWYWASSDLRLDSSGWNLISGANSKTYTIPSTMNGRYLKVEATASSKTLSAKLSSPVGGSQTGSMAVTIENYSAGNSEKNETAVRFVFSKPLTLAGVGGTYKPVENNYDFKYSGQKWFSVRVGVQAASEDDSLVASAIYSTQDNSITVTLAGEAALVKNRVIVKINRTMYDISGAASAPSSLPAAVRIPNCSSWQNGGADGTGALDTSPPRVAVSAAGTASTVLRLVFDEPLGYLASGVCRPAPDGYNFKNAAGPAGLFSIKLGGIAAADSDSLVASALYSLAERTITVTLQNVRASESVAIVPLLYFRDAFGNALSPANAGVYYRRADDTKWYAAGTQAEADKGAAGENLEGSPVILDGDPPKYNAPLSAVPGTLNVTTGLSYRWYRSADTTRDSADILVGSGSKYTPVESDIGKYLILVATSAAIPGEREVCTGDVVQKADAIVSGKTVSVNFVAGGVFDLDGISGLFEVNSDGARTYRFPEDATYPGASISGSILTVPGAGEFRLLVRIAGSAKYNAYDGEAAATLRVIDPAPRTIPATPLSIPSGTAFTDADLGKAWLKVYLTGEGNLLYLKNARASSSVSLGEPLGRGDPFSGAGYTLLSGSSNSRDFTGAAIPGGSAGAAAAGTYYLVETTSDNRVVATGVVTLTGRNILARVTVTNNCSAKTVRGYGVHSSASTYYVAETLSGSFHNLYVPLDTTSLTLYENAPSGTSAPSGAKYNASLTFDSCRAVITVSDSVLK